MKRALKNKPWNAKPAKTAKTILGEFFACFAGFAFNRRVFSQAELRVRWRAPER